MCSLAARGLWIELIGYMHEGEPYGHLTINEVSPSINDIAALVGRPVAEVKKAMAELEKHQVFSRDDDDRMYSRRMVRDKAKADQDKMIGGGGGNPNLLKEDNGGVNPPDNQPDKAHIPEARSQRRNSYDEKFEEAWQVYPKRDGGNPKLPAEKRFLAAVKAGADPQIIIDGIKRYAVAEARNIGTPFIPQMVKWLGDQRWNDYGAGQTATVFNIRGSLV
jgi:hypothetical protein